MLFGAEFMNLGNSSELTMLYKKSEAQKQNFIQFQELFNRFSNIAITRYKWSGLPNTVSERFLNISLYLKGNSAFFWDDTLGYMTLPCTIEGTYNAYYEPLVVNAYSFNISKRLSNMGEKEEFVYIRNNPTATPTALIVMRQCLYMSDLLRTIEVIVKRMKQPYIILCDEKQRLTYQNLIKNIQDNEILVLASKDYGLTKNNMELIPTPTNADLNALWDSYRNYESIICTALGIENGYSFKRERQLVDEINANNMFTDMNIEQNIKELQLACEKINERWGLNVWVESRTVSEYRSEEGGTTDGEVYNGIKGTD